ncbi:MAG: hypothetical protein GX154_06000 [Clostridiales bacterium]|nr:hypothetical protein [Clostridiales bacterium]
MAGQRGRPPKQKVKIKEILSYIEQLPDDNDIKLRLTPDKMIRFRRYIEELQYLEYTIVNLKADIEKNGQIEIYKNGSQETRRANPALTTYVDVVKTYNQLFRQASEILRGTEIDIEKNWM